MKRPNINIGYWEEVKLGTKIGHVRDWGQYEKDIEKYVDYLEASQRQQLIEFADWFTAKDGNEAEVDTFLENNE